MPTDSSEPLPPNDPLRQLQRRFLLGICAVGVLATLNQLIVQPWLIRLTSDAPVINVAGRQRMLSQKLAKSALQLAATWPDDEASSDNGTPAAQEALQELSKAVQEWATAHRGLQFGDASLGLPANGNAKIGRAFEDLEPHFGRMRDAALRLQREAADPEVRRAAVATILSEEREYLPRMHAIVGLFEADARDRITVLQRAGWVILGVILLLLAALSRFAIRPVLRAVELRVAERTERLRAMNTQLEHEILERRQAEERTRELLDQLAHASRLNSLGQLAAGLAHELNQPLGAITNYAEAAQCYLDQELPDSIAARQALGRISGASLRAGTIVHRLRNFIRSGRHQREAVDAQALIAEVIELCDPEARKRDVRVLFEPGKRPLPRITADPIQLQQVLVNLLQNAMQALDGLPAERREIRVTLTCDADELRIDVADRGPGFTREQQDRLFDPFVTTRAEGLGMGLAICRSIIQEHGGRLWAISPAAGGAVFSFSLPLQTPHDELADYLHSR